MVKVYVCLLYFVYLLLINTLVREPCEGILEVYNYETDCTFLFMFCIVKIEYLFTVFIECISVIYNVINYSTYVYM